MKNKEKEKDFEERLKRFALACIKLIHLLPKSQENTIYSRQLIRCSSSIGANYSEAVCALTRKDFIYDMNKCRKETKESHYWIELILRANPVFAHQIQPSFEESHELLKIFQKSAITLRKNSK